MRCGRQVFTEVPHGCPLAHSDGTHSRCTVHPKFREVAVWGKKNTVELFLRILSLIDNFQKEHKNALKCAVARVVQSVPRWHLKSLTLVWFSQIVAPLLCHLQFLS